ncbi:calcineurin-binding protein cabin-1-like [Colias croceus]|uniref:calcineurin-binding protein cabin-1-like n=1 Tax=Colias crocea TaxID=72248 RepID=UPI001E27C747|nr:calcineurin-binding protein cabin-1-like [Colias croceus]
MIKIAALNTETEEDSGSEEEVSREALEQIALQQYAKVLELQRNGNLPDATQLIKDLLDTELLYDVKKPAPGEKITGPLYNLKYVCYKNLAGMLSASGELEGSMDAYTSASELDDTDVTLWHKLGLVCLRAKHYERALYAFERGVEINPRHWPCIDKIVTLLLGLDFKEQCIAVIHDALELDPGYLRGIVYRRHIYTVFRHMKDYMEYLHPIYKWDLSKDEPVDEKIAQKLLKEADEIYETFIEQQRETKFTYKMPDLTLQKPISNLTWESVGESLVHMHRYITENALSHAAFIQLVYEKEVKEEKMEVCEEAQESDSTKLADNKPDETATDTDKNTDIVTSENENNDMSDKEKPATDNEKVESDIEIINVDQSAETTAEQKAQKKAPVRRRGSALSFLEQWVWCNKRRSGRKKTKQDTIYDILRRMVPESLVPELIKKKENETRETSPTDLTKLFEEKDKDQEKSFENDEYFNTEAEQKDVNAFINKYMEDRRDIIDMLKDYLKILSQKWKLQWPENLIKYFIEANECYNNHIDVPACTDDNNEDLLHYITVNLLVEEFCINKKLNTKSEEAISHCLSVINHIEIILTFKPQIFESVECLEVILRQLWIKLHIYILNKEEDFALDCLYQLFDQFEAMGEHKSSYRLEIINFSFKPIINENEVVEYIKFLERNKKLSTVNDLYNRKCYEEVLAIITDSFEHCKIIAKEQEEEMSLDFAVQLTLILETYWALNKVDDCFRWSFICLHEALKHYFRYTSGSADYEKWTLTIVKILTCMEHILETEGYYCLSAVSQKELSQGLEDIIRIIGHQMETNTSDMPFDTTSPWIIMHYILQREEDQGRGRVTTDKEKAELEEDVSDPLMLLFIAHEQLGSRGWCTKSDGKLLHFILDSIVPLLRTPALSKCLEQVRQYLEQCVYCLYGHPERKQKLKYIADHNATAQTLNWAKAQQIYEIYRPLQLPALEGKLSGISADTELLFHRILGLLPPECDPQKYLPQLEKYIKGVESKLPVFPPLLPFKMKDIYFLIGDHHFKKEERDMCIKYNMLDIIINRDRFISWAQISLAKALNLVRILNSCQNLNNEREFLTPAKSTLRCYQRSLELKPDSSILTEYGNFAYAVHSFCSRLLKQASELLSMEDFEALERQKEDLLDTTQKCFTTVLYDNTIEKANDEYWLFYYMLGKVAEKRNKPPSVYLDYYMKGVKSLQETGATYPSKISYSSSTNFCLEVLELHYRIHASILKYIEQHENKPIPAAVGKVFLSCIEEWQQGPFIRRSKKDNTDGENEKSDEPSIHAANILKRSISDAGEEDNQEGKRLKLEVAAAKVRRSASCDTERIKEAAQMQFQSTTATDPAAVKDTVHQNSEQAPMTDVNVKDKEKQETVEVDAVKPNTEKQIEVTTDKKEESSSSSSSSSSDSSSSDSSSDSSTDSGKDSDTSSKSSQESKPLTDEEIMKIVLGCQDALEDCASRFAPHYKAIYRLGHYHFYYKKGKNIERCRDLMLSSFTCRSGKKLSGLFSERRNNNFFNNIWKIKLEEVDRAGSFAFHMNRSVLLTMEILKEIDDHKTLLDLSINLQKIPDADKKYLRDSDREDLAQQAISLCVQSLRGQVVKFSQQPDLKSNDVEREALKSLMLDIFRAYQRVIKLPNSTNNSTSTKQFSNLLIDAYKLLRTTPVTENMNLLDLALKYGHSLKQQAAVASLEKSQNFQKKQGIKSAENTKSAPIPTPQIRTDTKSQPITATASTSSALPKMSPHDITAAFQNYVPFISDYLNALQNISSLQAPLPALPIQNSFQAEFYRQFLGQSLSSYNLQLPKPKQKRGPKPGSTRTTVSSQLKHKSFTGVIPTTKATPTPVITSLQKSASASLAPSMGTVLPTLPASMTVNLPAFTGHSSLLTSHVSTSSVPQAHMSTTSTVNTAIHSKPPLPHQQVSPGKTLQEKLAERQKINPSVSKNLTADVSASISRLPSSLTITKTLKQTLPAKKPEAKKTLTFNEPERPKPITSDEIIILDDD